ncbi:MAG TPA: pilus assembly protein TadG-related protein [Gaiellales bacterium]|nr:pilus assembly protein TadG-related protein [Gaiellales bacterium]
MSRRREDGAVLVLVVLSLVVLLGMAALVIDGGGFRSHRRQLQTAADAGALAGAQKLINHPDQACSTAEYYQRQNDDGTDPRNAVVDANLDTSFCEILTSPGCSQPCAVRVQPTEADVPYIFGRVLGFINTDISARARARIVYLTKSKGLLPFGVEDLRPTSVTVVVDKTGQQISLAQSGCFAATPEGYPYWCSGAYVNNLPAGGSTISVQAVDSTGQTITWNQIGYLGSDQSIAGGTCTAGVVCVKDVNLSPLGDPYLYYTSTSSPKSFTVLAHLTNVNGLAVKMSYATGGGAPGNGAFQDASLVSGTQADGTWSVSFSSATTEQPPGQDIYIKVGTGGGAQTTAVPAQHAYARDDGDILQQYVQDRHYIDPAAAANTATRFVNFNLAFQVLVKGRIITLKLGGGGAQGNSGNYQGLDLDTNSSWPTYACYANGGIPNTADEVQHGSCTPYAIGDSVSTQTGNFAGQVDSGLQKRIGSSPNQWNPNNPPPDGDPRWMSLILVPPLTFSSCNGTCTTTVIGFGGFYITEWSGQAGSTLKPGEVRGIFWDRPSAINQYATSCNEPNGICLESVALEPWDG